MNDNNEIWKNARGILEKANNKTTFNLWIKPITVKFDGNTAYLFLLILLVKTLLRICCAKASRKQLRFLQTESLKVLNIWRLIKMNSTTTPTVQTYENEYINISFYGDEVECKVLATYRFMDNDYLLYGFENDEKLNVYAGIVKALTILLILKSLKRKLN